MNDVQLYYRQRHEIDSNKWDQCIDSASNGLIYSYSFYLDQMADHWDAIILNDYDAVMALPWRKKFGIYYLYQPFLTPQLGIIGKNISNELLQRFIEAVPEKFRFWEINFNGGNSIVSTQLSVKKKHNYFLALNQSYEEIKQGFNQNAKRNITKAIRSGCIYKNEDSFEEILTPAIRQFQNHSRFSKLDTKNFKTLVQKLIGDKKAKAVGVYQNGLLHAGAIFLLNQHTAYYILATTTKSGKETGASHYLIDQFIKFHANKITVLDFAGSDVTSVAFFYECFGAQVYNYPSIRINNLPSLIKWIKN
jgi:hypothetical protein